MTDPIPPALLTETDAAAMLGIHRDSLRDMRRAGTGPAHMRLTDAPRSPIRYRLEDITTWINARLVQEGNRK